MATYAKHEIAMAVRELLEAWGIESKATTPEDAFADLAKNPPFGVKKQLVEIVPEQSVTAERINDGWGERHYTEPAGFKMGTIYNVVINGKVKKLESQDFDGDIGVEDDEICIYDAPGNSNDKFIICWDTTSFGEIITLSITSVQEVVTQINPKFVGGKTRWYVSQGQSTIYTDIDCTVEITQEEFDSVNIENLVIVVDMSGYYNYCTPVNKDYNTITIYYSGSMTVCRVAGGDE